MNGVSTIKVDVFSTKSFFVCLILIVASWVAVFYQGIATAVEIWLTSDIFNHCLFVLPGSIFLIYLKRDELSLRYFKPNFFVLFLCIGSLTLYAIGLAGDVQLFMHVAIFTFLPLSIWAFIGNQLALKILFPLVFILFCIPVGEELIPAMQEVTADLSMVMLNWTGIPIYRSGLYIEIPQGRFLVAEACSGISFFIASVVIGSLYAYLNIRSTKRRVIFMLISIIFPVIANGIRVFGIILTGYLTDMEHAVGADHLIYGWVFFCIVIVCLLGIGELVREKEIETETKLQMKPDINPSHYTFKTCYQLPFSIIAIMLIFLIWFKIIYSQLDEPSNANKLVVPITTQLTNYKSSWVPEFKKPYQQFQFLSQLNSVDVDVYIVWYPRGHGELISSLNKLYTEKAWTLESKDHYQLDDGQTMDISTIVNPSGKRFLSYWYVVDGKIFTDNKMAKLYEIYRIMSGSYLGSGLVALSQPTENTSVEQNKINFVALTKDNLRSLSKYFDFE